MDKTIQLSPSQEQKDGSALTIDLSKKVLVPASEGEMIWVYPNTRVRFKLTKEVLPSGPSTLIVTGHYVGGYQRSKSKLIQGSKGTEFKEDNGRVSLEVAYEKTEKWTFIIASVRDFLLIDYIAFRDDRGEMVVLQGKMK